jgi:hypothetical protein
MEQSDYIRGCFIRGCTGRGYHTPVIALSFDGDYYVYHNFPNWLFCDHHKENIGLEDLIDQPVEGKIGLPAFALIQQAFIKAKLSPPQREFTNLIWRLA